MLLSETDNIEKTTSMITKTLSVEHYASFQYFIAFN